MAGEGYSLTEVSKLLGLSRSIVSGLIDAGFVSPARGRRNEFRFTFHDLVILRAARGLSEAGLSSNRILRSLRRLKAQLPEQIPLAGLRIDAVGDAVVVSEGERQWQPDDGQYVLGFTVASNAGRVSFIDAPASAPAPSVPAQSAAEWFDKAGTLEEVDQDAACAAYRASIAADPSYGPAYTNLGRLLHERGQFTEAEAVYREGLARSGPDGVLLFNLGVLLEDENRSAEAAGSYRAALKASPELADAHYNLALICEAKGLRQEALRHLSAFRKYNV